MTYTFFKDRELNKTQNLFEQNEAPPRFAQTDFGLVLSIAIVLVPILMPMLVLMQGAIAQPVSDLDRLRETSICPSCELSGADLSGMDLSGANLRGARLNGANLTNTDLQYADLANAILNGALLGGANFRFADLTNASLQGATISPAADFTGAILDATVMPNGGFRNPQPSPTP